MPIPVALPGSLPIAIMPFVSSMMLVAGVSVRFQVALAVLGET